MDLLPPLALAGALTMKQAVRTKMHLVGTMPRLCFESRGSISGFLWETGLRFSCAVAAKFLEVSRKLLHRSGVVSSAVSMTGFSAHWPGIYGTAHESGLRRFSPSSSGPDVSPGKTPSPPLAGKRKA